ncbi:hypothetical protein RND71_036320 [Anisodus tanguticus]|uniref:DUF4283 domain-containing protein n=1 Tax=Anisodus tanguticus TaxID=243964 RepID=A0AAE1UXP6_9SOLA|nr:hypothetical protein RND71_036320 [Anisodus tanguticus]
MAIPATGRPPPEVGHPPPNPAHPLDYSQLFKSSPTIPPLQISETANGENPRPCGDPSPMSIPIPIKPIVYLHGEPSIRFEKKEVEVMIHHQELTLAIVGKFSHGWPDIAFLRNAIPKQCGLKAEVRIGLLCDRHVLIRCTIGEDFDTLMSRQTFEIKEKTKPYLMRTFKWDVSFNPAEESRFAYREISFPGLSPHYYGESTLFSLAAAVGSPIAIDAATLNKTRPSCARVKVEFDLLKSHPQHVVIQVGEGDGITTELQKIRYDFKPKYCTNCKLQGHDVDGCWNLKPALRTEKAKDSDGGKVATTKATEVALGKGKASIPTPSSSNPSQQTPNALIHAPSNNWTTVTRKNKKNKHQNPKPPSKVTGTVIPAIGTVIPEPRAIGNTVQVSESFSETVNGGTPLPCGTPSPMAMSIPLKPIVYLHGEPTIRFEKKEVEVMIHHQDLTMAVVGKFCHGWPDIAFLRTAIPKQCGLKAEVRIGLLCDRHVLIRCTIGEDFDTLMSRQTFEIKEKTKTYLMRTFKWEVTFNPLEESRFAYGWISFPGLSPHYYGESTLFSLAAAVGTPIAIDAATLNKTRPSCARVKVEFDLLKTHPPHVVIQVGEGDGITSELQKIRYDFKPKYCTNCKLQGHDVDGFWTLKPELRPEKAKEIDGGKAAMAVTASKGKATNPNPSSSNPSQQTPLPTTNVLIHAPSNNWTTVTRKNKKNKNQNPKPLSKVTGTVIPATGTVIPEPRAIGNTVQVSESISETANGGSPRPCGDPSPMSIPIPIKPIVYLHGEPTIRFEKKEVEVMIHHQELTLAIVGKFSHGWPDIAFIRNAIPKQCGLKAEVRIGLLLDRHVLIRCSIVEDFDTLMSRQTFEIKEKNKPYLMRTFKWDISFNPAEESRFAYGWISFPGLPPHYYGESTLFSLAAAVGSPIAIDSATLNKTRPSCARVKVEFDLLKNHPQHVVIQVGEGDGITSELQKIRYDFKPKYCTYCKLQGHDVDGCWNLQPALRLEKAKEIDGGKMAKAVETTAAIGKGKASIPTSSSSNPSQQAPLSTTNVLIQHPSNNWIPVTRKNKKNKNQILKPPSKPTGTVIPADRNSVSGV